MTKEEDVFLVKFVGRIGKVEKTCGMAPTLLCTIISQRGGVAHVVLLAPICLFLLNDLILSNDM
jgi:hypothetical protein